MRVIPGMLGRRLGRAHARLVAGWRRTRYRLAGGGPDPSVPDDVLVDRVRSMLGPLEKRLDLPRVHVSVMAGVAILHGCVGADDERTAIVIAVRRIPGIRSVDDRLHVGLGAGDTRPSAGRHHPTPSRAYERLVTVARHAGDVDAESGARLAGAVVTTLAERLPPGERAHLLLHLPEDAQQLADLPRSAGESASRIRTVEAFLASVGRLADLDEAAVFPRDLVVARAVLAELRAIVPEETDDVEAVLPRGLRELWRGVGDA